QGIDPGNQPLSIGTEALDSKKEKRGVCVCVSCVCVCVCVCVCWSWQEKVCQGFMNGVFALIYVPPKRDLWDRGGWCMCVCLSVCVCVLELAGKGLPGLYEWSFCIDLCATQTSLCG